MTLVVQNPEGHYRVQKNPQLVPVLNQISPVHFPAFCFFETHFNIILPYSLMFPKRPFCIRFPHQNPVCICLLPHLCNRSKCPRKNKTLEQESHKIGKQLSSDDASYRRTYATQWIRQTEHVTRINKTKNMYKFIFGEPP